MNPVLRTQLEMVQGQVESMKADQDTENKILLALNPVATKLNDMQKNCRRPGKTT